MQAQTKAVSWWGQTVMVSRVGLRVASVDGGLYRKPGRTPQAKMNVSFPFLLQCCYILLTLLLEMELIFASNINCRR